MRYKHAAPGLKMQAADQVASGPGKHQPAKPAGEAEASQRAGQQAGRRTAGGTPRHDQKAAIEAVRAGDQAPKRAGKNQEKNLAKSSGTDETAKICSLC